MAQLNFSRSVPVLPQHPTRAKMTARIDTVASCQCLLVHTGQRGQSVRGSVSDLNRSTRRAPEQIERKTAFECCSGGSGGGGRHSKSKCHRVFRLACVTACLSSFVFSDNMHREVARLRGGVVAVRPGALVRLLSLRVSAASHHACIARKQRFIS
jgi:hypothetical protein